MQNILNYKIRNTWNSALASKPKTNYKCTWCYKRATCIMLITFLK